MTNRQIQPVRNRDIQIIRQARPRSVWGQVWNVTLQPTGFFLALPQAPSSSRQWFWVAILILALNGFSAVRQEAIRNGSGGSSDPAFAADSSFSDPSSGGFSAIPGGISAQPSIPSGPPVDFGPPTDSGSESGGSDVSSSWVTALISASTILVGWFILAIILCEVPLFNGVRPTFGQNLQIAIWTTVPLGVMAGLQVIYIAAAGQVGAEGISGLLTLWKGYDDLSPFLRSVLLSLTSHLTVFWVWTLVLIYIGARQALNGKVWSSALVVVIWALVVIMVPVATGAISAPEAAVEPLPEPIVLPDSNAPLGEGEVTPLADEFDVFPTIDPADMDATLGTPLALPAGSGVVTTVESEAPSLNSIVTEIPSNSQPTSEDAEPTALP